MSTPPIRAHAEPKTAVSVLRVFISYRQGPDEGDPCATWIHERLQGQPIPLADGRVAAIEVYRDVNAPGISDWREKWRADLQTCRAMILVCTPGAAARRK